MAERGTCQDTEGNRPSKAHSPTRDGRGRLVRTQKKPIEQGTPTLWRRQREGLVRTQKETSEQRTLTSWRRQRERPVRTRKETDRGRRTHVLKTAEGGMSGHRKESTKRGALTNWRQQREELVRTRKEAVRVRHTHFLETAEAETRQDKERIRPSKAHSLSGDSRGRYLSGHGKNPTEQGTLTNWIQQRGRLVTTRNEKDRARPTHFLEVEEGGTCQNTERTRPTKAHSHTGDGKGRGLSGHAKKSTERGALTNWRRQRKGLVRTRKETDRARRTHVLETAERGIFQDTERNRPTEAHSLPGDGGGRDLSGHRKKPTEQGALTFWRRQRERLVRTRKKPTDQGALTLCRRQREGLVRTRKEKDRARGIHRLEMTDGGTCQDTKIDRPSETLTNWRQ